jgi:hypothetical protein
MCNQCADVGHDSESSTVSKPERKGDDPLFRRVAERMTSRRTTLNHEGRCLRVDRHLFRDAVGIQNLHLRCERRQAKAGECAQRWCVTLRFFNDSVYLERCGIILDEGKCVMREHSTAQRPGVLGRVAQLQGKHRRVTVRVSGHDNQNYEPETGVRLSKSGEIVSVTSPKRH